MTTLTRIRARTTKYLQLPVKVCASRLPARDDTNKAGAFVPSARDEIQIKQVLLRLSVSDEIQIKQVLLRLPARDEIQIGENLP